MNEGNATHRPMSPADTEQFFMNLVGEVEASRARIALLTAAVVALVDGAPKETLGHVSHLLGAVAETYAPAPILDAFPGAADAARILAIRYATALIEAMTPKAGQALAATILPFPGGGLARPPSPAAPEAAEASPNSIPSAPPPGSRLPNSGKELPHHE